MTATGSTTTYRIQDEQDTPRQRRRAGRFGRELGYLLTGLPLGIAAFTVVLTALALGTVGFVLVVGMPVLLAALAVAHTFARLERRRVAHVTGRPFPEPHPRERHGTGVTGWLHALRDAPRWRALAHALVSFPLRVVSFSLALTWTLGGLGALLYGTWSWSLPRDEGEEGLLDLMFGISSQAADIAFNTAIGALLLATAVPLVRGLTALHTALAHGLLGSGTDTAVSDRR
ncbi:sensor domain-containing protein [Streptomyces avicenniae]|uniref:sensor domain-containing protein n=1 Tax=Streptomyces avicenniae TaxID=500153 RepID=UPI000A87145F|nr:sensor domain-containing protein [Streptomyces avicenniae]